MILHRITKEDDTPIAEIIRAILKTYKLDIPGTVYYDENLYHLSDFYLADTEKRDYFIAEENGKIIGGVGLAELSFLESTAELQKLYLVNEVRGRGLGAELIAAVEMAAKEKGYSRLYLETHTNLFEAIGLYEKTGFSSIEKPDFVQHSTMNRFYIKELV